ncbi:MAG TPA: PglZ domain-containing protein, partial [Chromatiales bacterium]|nr:PglZ domain-containing protein [Chromatiales bacterium]
PTFDGFDRARVVRFADRVGMVEYSDALNPFMRPLFAAQKLEHVLGQVIADAGLRQLRIAETEKYAHVTFFFNGGKEQPFAGEDRVMVPSPKVATYDLKPDMSAADVADATIAAIQKNEYAFILVNFANGDMVGHTAIRDAVITAVEAVDTQAGRVVDAAMEAGYSVIVTADHGNCDEMVDPITREPHTQHTIYPVPCIIIDEQPWRLRTGGGIANIAATVLELMGLPAPKKMKGSLLLGPVQRPS